MSNRRNGTPAMPRPRKQAPKTGKREQYNVSFDAASARRIEETAAALGLDGVSLIRTIVVRNLAKYEEEAAQARADAARAAAKK